jgi:hypothetical protein
MACQLRLVSKTSKRPAATVHPHMTESKRANVTLSATKGTSADENSMCARARAHASCLRFAPARSKTAVAPAASSDAIRPLASTIIALGVPCAP